MLIQCADEGAQMQLGAQLAQAVKAPCLIFLKGDLGAGKTTLARGFLRQKGWQGAVRSPTYTLIEPYPFDDGTVYHLDLYRLGDPEELEYLGMRDMLAESSILLVEWPEQGADWLPAADLILDIQQQKTGRVVDLSSATQAGNLILQRFSLPSGCGTGLSLLQ